MDVIGIDIGKNTFHRPRQARGDRAASEVPRPSRARLANVPRCLVGMEPCVGAHHLSRRRALLVSQRTMAHP